ncbi:MAG: carbohydrate ABC transporter permease [Anaerolineae bacterium]|jgi:raffinose/stachyose/melibiose transport system permease protein
MHTLDRDVGQVSAMDVSTKPRSRFMLTVGRMRRRSFCYLFLLPTFVLLAMFNYWPALSALYHSFFQWNGANFKEWYGIQNFIQIFQDSVMRTAFKNMFIISGFGLVISITFPLAAAALIFHLQDLKFAYFYRVMYVVPMVVPGMVTLMIWRFIYNPQVGLLNALLEAIGLPTRIWLGDFQYALYALIFIGFPWVAGTSMLIYLAGLQGIEPSLLDAAAIDGASGLKRFWYLELPLVASQIKLIVILTLIGAIQGFQGPLVMTGGGPGTTTMVPGLWLYKNAMNYNKMGYACAIGTFLFIVTMGLTFINLRFVQSSAEFEGA